MKIKKIIFFLLLLCPLWMQAQFDAVDWYSSRTDSVLPVCTSVIDLPGDYKNYTYSAHIEYPEYQKMKPEEVERYRLQSCPTLCYPMDCSLPGSSTRGVSRQESWSGLLCPPL